MYVERKGIFLHSDFKEKNERIIIFKISERESEKRKRREKCTLKRNLRFLRIFMQQREHFTGNEQQTNFCGKEPED